MKRVLLLAGQSFLGKHLHVLLEQLGHEVISTTRAACDVTDAAQVDAVVRQTQPVCIVNCAAATARASPDCMQQVHVHGTENLLGAMAKHVPNASVVLFGSAAEYGNVEPRFLPVTEEYPARPESPFGQSKLAQLHVAERFAAEHGLRVLVLRPFNILGPGLPGHYLAAALIDRLRQARANGQTGPFPVANAHATRDWIDVRDVAAAVVELLRQDIALPGRFKLFNVATGKETSVLSLADKLCRLAGDFHAVPGEETSSRSGIQRSCGDARRLMEATGWKPRITWQKSLEEMWNE
jgi:GDP-4-dehydro-6-deoxy-D-mannose reductase